VDFIATSAPSEAGTAITVMLTFGVLNPVTVDYAVFQHEYVEDGCSHQGSRIAGCRPAEFFPSEQKAISNKQR
jgi:hypothetical protein